MEEAQEKLTIVKTDYPYGREPGKLGAKCLEGKELPACILYSMELLVEQEKQ